MRRFQSNNLQNPQQATPPQSPGTHTGDTEESSSAGSGQPAVQIMRRIQSNYLENPQQATPPHSPGTHTGDTKESSSAASGQPAIMRRSQSNNLENPQQATPPQSPGTHTGDTEKSSSTAKGQPAVKQEKSPASSTNRHQATRRPTISNDVRDQWMKCDPLYECFWCAILYKDAVIHNYHMSAHRIDNPFKCVCGSIWPEGMYHFNMHLYHDNHRQLISEPCGGQEDSDSYADKSASSDENGIHDSNLLPDSKRGCTQSGENEPQLPLASTTPATPGPSHSGEQGSGTPAPTALSHSSVEFPMVQEDSDNYADRSASPASSYERGSDDSNQSSASKRARSLSGEDQGDSESDAAKSASSDETGSDVSNQLTASKRAPTQSGENEPKLPLSSTTSALPRPAQSEEQGSGTPAPTSLSHSGRANFIRDPSRNQPIGDDRRSIWAKWKELYVCYLCEILYRDFVLYGMHMMAHRRCHGKYKVNKQIFNLHLLLDPHPDSS